MFLSCIPPQLHSRPIKYVLQISQLSDARVTRSQKQFHLVFILSPDVPTFPFNVPGEFTNRRTDMMLVTLQNGST